MTWIGGLLVLLGSTFSLMAAVGLLRFPHLYARLHAATMIGPLGAGVILLGLGVTSENPSVAIRCLLAMALLILVSPVSTHLLARAALRADRERGSSASIDSSQ